MSGQEFTPRFVDADTHVDETEQTWEYMDEKERRFKPVSFSPPSERASEFGSESGDRMGGDRGRDRLWLVDGQTRRRVFRNDTQATTTQATRTLEDVEARLRDMDDLGIDVQVIYPTFFNQWATDRPDVYVALARSYNRWLADRTALSGGRLRWVVVLPTMSIPDAIEQIRFGKDNGACGVMKKGVEWDRTASDPYFFPIYEEAQRVGLPICFHQGVGNPNTNQSGAKAAVLSAFSSLASGGIPAKFPGLKFGFIEAGASWIPYLIKELGMRGASERAGYDFRTGLLAHNRFYVTCDTEDDLSHVLNFGAEDYLVIGTDYTHHDSSAELKAHQVIMERAERGELSKTVATKIVRDNAQKFYEL